MFRRRSSVQHAKLAIARGTPLRALTATNALGFRPSICAIRQTASGEKPSAFRRDRIFNRTVRRIDILLFVRDAGPRKFSALTVAPRDVVADRQTQQHALQYARHHVYEPRAPAGPSDSQPEAESEDECAWHLYQHGDDAQALDVADLERVVYLREVLDGCENTGHGAEEVCPAEGVVWEGSDHGDARDADEEKGEERGDSHDYCVAALGWGGGGYA